MDTAGANRLIGKKLRGLRAENKVSRERLAELSGVNYSTLRRIEDGESAVLVPALAAMTKVLGVPVSDFLNAIQDDLDKLADADAGESGEK